MTAKKTAVPEPVEEPVEVEDAPPAEPKMLDIIVRDTPLRVFADARDDFEILDDVRQIEKGDIACLTELMRRMMPESDRAKALDLARSDNGRVTLDAALDLMGDVFKGMNNPN